MKFAAKPALLSQAEMDRVHEASLWLLEKKGILFQLQEARELFAAHGSKVDGERVCIPRKLVEDSLKQTPQTFLLEAVNPANTISIGKGLAIHPAGGEVNVSRGQRVREGGTLKDFADIQKIYQACPHMDMTGYQPLAPLDIPVETRSLHCTFETMLYTDKPWLAPMGYENAETKQELLAMYKIVFGQAYVENHYVTWNVVSPNSPLVYGKMACEGILSFVRANQPVCIVSAPMTGITSPVHSYSTILLQNAETLAGICLAQMAKPGIPVIPSASLTYGNLRLATWECACPDTALMLAGAVQMYKEYYHLPARAQTGVTSSKCVDYQAGFETMQSLLLCALLDVNVTSQSVGSLENLLTLSFEKTVIDDEIISRVRRITQGINTDEAHLGLDLLMAADFGQDFLMEDSTLENLHAGWQPDLSDWNLYGQWSAREDRDICARAEKRVQEILDEAKPLLSADTAAALKKYIDHVGG